MKGLYLLAAVASVVLICLPGCGARRSGVANKARQVEASTAVLDPSSLSPVKWCNKSGQRSAAVPVVEILVNAADADLLVRGGVEKREAIFQAEPAGVERVWTQRAPRRGVACGPEGRAAGPFREAKSSRQSSRLSIPAHRPGGRATISLL